MTIPTNMSNEAISPSLVLEIKKIHAIATEDARLSKVNGIDLNPFTTVGGRHLWQQGWGNVRPANLVDGSVNWRFWERGRQAKIIAQENETIRIKESTVNSMFDRVQESDGLTESRYLGHLDGELATGPVTIKTMGIAPRETKKITARELAEKYGHGNIDSNTTLKSTVNPDAETQEREVEMMDLRVCGVGSEAFFEWITEDGDPIGDIFDEIDEADLVLTPSEPFKQAPVERG